MAKRTTKRQTKPKEPATSDAQATLPGSTEPKAKTSKPPAKKPRAKKVNRSAKGTAIELMAIKQLESEGYTVHRCVRTGVKRGPNYYSQSNDVFGCIDLVAKKLGERTRWIQVTADSGIGRKKEAMLKVPWDTLFDAVEIWRWVGGKHGRKDKRTGQVLPDMYFQVYHLDDDYERLADRRIPIQTNGEA